MPFTPRAQQPRMNVGNSRIVIVFLPHGCDEVRKGFPQQRRLIIRSSDLRRWKRSGVGIQILVNFQASFLKELRNPVGLVGVLKINPETPNELLREREHHNSSKSPRNRSYPQSRSITDRYRDSTPCCEEIDQSRIRVTAPILSTDSTSGLSPGIIPYHP